jgi:hypothetical protein
MLMVEYLTTYKDYYMCVEQILLVVLYLLFYFGWNANRRSMIPRTSTTDREAWRISFIKDFIIGNLFVVHVFVVYMSCRDEEF